MDPTTVILILIVIVAVSAHLAFEKTNDKIDDLQAELSRMAKEQTDEQRNVRRLLLAVDDKAYAAAEGVADLRVHQENH